MSGKSWNTGWTSPPEGWRELTSFHATVLANARLAFNVLVSRDPATARQLVRGEGPAARPRKTHEQQPFRAAARRHAKSVETSSIHLDTIRDLKQINSLLASMAYPVLEEHGLLGGSRLKAVEPAQARAGDLAGPLETSTGPRSAKPIPTFCPAA